MAAYYLPTLCTAPKPYLCASRHSGQLTISTAAACRRRGASRIEAAAGDCTKHSAWTSIRQERWEGDLAVEGRIPAWLVRTRTYIYTAAALSKIINICHTYIYDWQFIIQSSHSCSSTGEDSRRNSC
jgi:carlactone synthase/all-trans-10'-apo-beta-carotenal 13,14-cleaving dioxygenase